MNVRMIIHRFLTPVKVKLIGFESLRRQILNIVLTAFMGHPIDICAVPRLHALFVTSCRVCMQL